MEVKSLLVKFGTDTAAMEAGFKKADGLIAANAENFKKAGRIMTVAGAAIVGSIGLMIKNYTDAGDAIHKMSKRTGFSCEALSALKYAAEISGSSIESLEKGVKKMSMSIYDGTRGSLEYVEAFEQIGLSAEELVDLSPEEQFMKIAEGLAEMENKGTRAALAQKLLGRAGTELLPLFEEGEDGIKRLTEEAARMGFISDTEAAANSSLVYIASIAQYPRVSMSCCGQEVPEKQKTECWAVAQQRITDGRWFYLKIPQNVLDREGVTQEMVDQFYATFGCVDEEYDDSWVYQEEE